MTSYMDFIINSSLMLADQSCNFLKDKGICRDEYEYATSRLYYLKQMASEEDPNKKAFLNSVSHFIDACYQDDFLKTDLTAEINRISYE